MRDLAAWLKQKRESGVKIIYPDSEDVFRAFRLCPFDKVKVVILGQEPYYQGNADGLSFSYKNGLRMGVGKQALDVIFDEIEQDCYDGLAINRDYQLEYLAKQGVLLLNVVLTVFKGLVGSHKGMGWENFNTYVIMKLILDPRPKVFMLWGNEAKNVYDHADYIIKQYSSMFNNDHLVLRAYHPAYDLHKRDTLGNITVKYPDGFTGCKHFSQANRFLLERNIGAIDWIPLEKNEGIKVISEDLPF
jgi:uracil-DNA glycosylase